MSLISTQKKSQKTVLFKGQRISRIVNICVVSLCISVCCHVPITGPLYGSRLTPASASVAYIQQTFSPRKVANCGSTRTLSVFGVGSTMGACRGAVSAPPNDDGAT